MLARFKHIDGIDPALFMNNALFSMKLTAFDKLERYAIVGAPAWINTAASAGNAMFPGIEIRTFAASDEQSAWDWLEAKPLP